MKELKTLYFSSYDTENDIIMKRDDTHTTDHTHTGAEVETFTNFEHIHQHDFYEISYVLSGSGIQMINDIRYPVQKGDLVILNLSDCHSYYPLNKLIILNALILPRLFTEHIANFENILDEQRNLKLPPVIRFSLDDFMTVERIMLAMEQEYDQRPMYYQQSMLHYLVLLFLYSMRAVSSESKSKIALNPILEYIANNLSTVSLTSAAAHSSYNPSYFSKMFHDKLGVTFIDYVNKLRINEAIRLITTTNYSIESICYMVGYKEKKNFYSLFKKHTGLTPAMFRKLPK